MSDLQTCPLGTANSAARAELTACADLAGDAGLAVPEGEVQSEDQGRAVSPSPTASMMANDKVTDDEQVPSLW